MVNHSLQFLAYIIIAIFFRDKMTRNYAGFLNRSHSQQQRLSIVLSILIVSRFPWLEEFEGKLLSASNTGASKAIFYCLITRQELCCVLVKLSLLVLRPVHRKLEWGVLIQSIVDHRCGGLGDPSRCSLSHKGQS